MCTEERSQSLLGAGLSLNLYLYKTGTQAGEDDVEPLVRLLLLPGVGTAGLGQHVHLSNLFSGAQPAFPLYPAQVAFAPVKATEFTTWFTASLTLGYL